MSTADVSRNPQQLDNPFVKNRLNAYSVDRSAASSPNGQYPRINPQEQQQQQLPSRSSSASPANGYYPSLQAAPQQQYQQQQQQQYQQHQRIQQQSANGGIDALQTIFGPQMQTWNFTEDTLQSALQVRLEQEKTKQEYYKAEALNRSLEIMKMAIHTKVPGHLIPTLFNVSDDTMMKLNEIQMQQIGQQKKAASAALLIV
ncbi:unnamed protein product [Ambrosiozyma monospora]|uniref:Unnamed protein product n=1 Tax=Ambrosiozyma monospora TaxID=43982 RepID=A0ACB5U6X8_AMBMO|nr:unnamed protein product [Ambrosiozyma monospora]